MHICVCFFFFLQSNLAGGQSTGDPDQIERFEGDQDEADVSRQVLGALRVHKVVSGVAAGVFFIAHRWGQVYPRNEIETNTSQSNRYQTIHRDLYVKTQKGELLLYSQITL